MGRSIASSSEDVKPGAIPVHASCDDRQHPAHGVHVARFAVQGIPTDVLFESFSDRIFVVITQLGKLGTVLTVDSDVALGGGLSFSINTLIGRRDEPVLELIARRVASSMADAGLKKSLLITLALRNHSKEVVKPILDAVEANKVW